MISSFTVILVNLRNSFVICYSSVERYTIGNTKYIESEFIDLTPGYADLREKVASIKLIPWTNSYSSWKGVLVPFSVFLLLLTSPRLKES